MPKKERLAVPASHVSRHISLLVTDPWLKARMRRIADKEGRTISNWLDHHWMPRIEQEIEREEKRLSLGPIEREASLDEAPSRSKSR